MATKKTRKRKKRPDIHLKDYVEEREVLLEYMKLNELRRFCKKLHKTAEILERDNDVYQIEKEKLLAYWNILDKQLWELVDEKRTTEIRKIEKSVHDQFSLSTQKKDLMTHNFLKAKKSYNFIITRMVNRNIIFHKLQNRHKELMYQLHQARKSYITPKFEDYRSDMYQYKVSFENSVALYEKLFDVFYSLQGQYFSNRFSINKDIYKKHDSIVGRLLKRKYNLVNAAIKRLNRHRDSMSRLSSIVHRRNEANTILLKNRLERTKAVYVRSQKHRETLKQRIRSLDNPNVLKSKERINMESVLKNTENVKKIIKKKLEKQRKIKNAKWYEANFKHIEAENKYINESKFVDQTRRLSFDEADQVIVNIMAKKLLSIVKLNSLKKKIRFMYYVLNEALKSDVSVEDIVKQIVTENHVPSISLDTVPRTSFKEMDGENDQFKNDPFGLDCVPDIDVQGSIPCTSMHHTCKQIIAEHKRIKKVDFGNKQPDEQIKLYEKNANQNYSLRFRLKNCMQRNGYHLDNVPVDIRECAAPNLNRYIKVWEQKIMMILKKKSLYDRFFEESESEEEEQQEEGEAEEEVEVDKKEESEQMEVGMKDVEIVELEAEKEGSVELEVEEEGSVELEAEEVGSVEVKEEKEGSVELEAEEVGSVEVNKEKEGSVELEAEKVGSVELEAEKVGSVELEAEKVGESDFTVTTSQTDFEGETSDVK